MIHSTTTRSRIADFLIYLIIAIITLTSIAPIVNTLAISLSSGLKAGAGQVTFLPKDFTFTSYQKILQDNEFYRAFLISVKRVLLGTSISLLLSFLMAYPLSRDPKDFFLRTPYMWIVVFTMMFSGGMIPLYMTVHDLHLMDTVWALVLPGAVGAFNVILLVNFFRSIPKEIDESASMDGAGPWFMLFRMYLPLSLPVIATVTLFVFIGHWNSFFDGLIYNNRPEHYPLQTYIQQLVVKIDPTRVLTFDELKNLDTLSDKTLNAAKIFVTMIPVMVVYPFLQKYFITGIMLGSVKE
ncbi:MAG: carbohydrate ABC transporter permease [Gorillibacterium sp.]|nr:carbohydrate ABC transporter permease [Gorillibacterium sp.]